MVELQVVSEKFVMSAGCILGMAGRGRVIWMLGSTVSTRTKTEYSRVMNSLERLPSDLSTWMFHVSQLDALFALLSCLPNH